MTQLLKIFISEEDIATIQNMAACNYAPSEIALQLGVDKKGFLALYNDNESDVRQAYNAGKLATTFEIMTKQKELAEGGNITSGQIFLKERDRIDFENIKYKTFFENGE